MRLKPSMTLAALISNAVSHGCVPQSFRPEQRGPASLGTPQNAERETIPIRLRETR
jgi:hypothetical protein